MRSLVLLISSSRLLLKTYIPCACMFICGGDVICVRHDLNRCSGGGMSAVYMLKSVGERMTR